jgi:hypothetical protein
MDVLCKTITVPDIIHEPIEIKYKGHNLKIPGRTNQEQTIEITFYMDENQGGRQLFSDWIGGMDDRYFAYTSGQSATIAQSKNWFGSILLKARDFDETKSEPMNYLIDGVYPLSVSGPAFNSGGTGEVLELTVSFAYFRFLSGDTSGAYDDLDAALDVFGLSPAEYSSLGGFGQIGGLISSGIRTINSVGNAISAVGNFFSGW